MGAENLAPNGIRSLDRPVHSESLYRLSYRGPSGKVFKMCWASTQNADKMHGTGKFCMWSVFVLCLCLCLLSNRLNERRLNLELGSVLRVGGHLIWGANNQYGPNST